MHFQYFRTWLEVELMELGLATLAFCDARGCWKMLDAGQLQALIVRADEMMWSMPIETQFALQAHFQQEMERVKKLSPGEEDALGKLQNPEASGISQGAEIPPAETVSLPVNGSVRNTESLSELPYGTRP